MRRREIFKLIARAATAALLFATAVSLSVGDAHAKKRKSARSGAPTEMSVDWISAPGDIWVSLADRSLYYMIDYQRALVYPIATPKPHAAWTGRYSISRKAKWPRWTPTRSMRRSIPGLPRYVKGGSRSNPLGARALYLGTSDYRIHGTNAPRSIGRAASRGCFRMLNAHVKDLYGRAQVGAVVTVVKRSLRPAEPLSGMLAAASTHGAMQQGEPHDLAAAESDPLETADTQKR